MAQRVYLVPVRPDLVDLFESAVLTESEGDLRAALGRIRDRAARHQRVNTASKRNAERLRIEGFGDRDYDYNFYKLQRPYLITAQDPREAAETVTELLGLEDDRALDEAFDRELSRLPSECVDAPVSRKREGDSDWQVIAADLPRVRGMRRAIRSGSGYTIERNKEEDLDGLTMITEETESVSLEGSELVETYGRLAGYTFARFAAYCEPTWWLGRDYWPGLLAGSLNPLVALIQPRLRAVQREILKRAESPSILFKRIAEAGFEEGFSLVCEGYSTGLYFPPAAVPAILESLEKDRASWLRLSRRATGYPEEGVVQLTQMVHEAFLWAAKQNVGLLEADEVVGIYGYR